MSLALSGNLSKMMDGRPSSFCYKKFIDCLIAIGRGIEDS